MKKIELLSPVGDFECLKAAVQNGANSVYLGASSFNARARATNFDLEGLKQAIKYAKSRNVSVHLTLNTLIKNEEFDEAVKLAIDAYNLGVDAIIVQDLGLAKYLIENYPEIPLHGSTQMTVHNLLGVKQLESLGFKRIVLARELPINEIEYIRKNTSSELEVFVHGALCISYSGQCLLSSMIGGRSGNRGLCAQPCRLPYELISSDGEILDKGYLLSPKDTCALEYLPELIKMGIDSFKIEGRMKTPLYVATVTKIYRKYIDFIVENINLDNEVLRKMIKEKMSIKNSDTNLSDLEELAQVFNRGGFSKGHFSEDANRNLIFKEKPNNMGIFLGTIHNFNPNKGHITLKLESDVSIGDKVSINDNLYTISELMINNKNYENIKSGNIVKIGRMKGKLFSGNKIYKIESSHLNKAISPTFKEDKNFKKISLNGKIIIKKGFPIEFSIYSNDGFYKDLAIKKVTDIIPEESINRPLLKEDVLKQLTKTGNTQFEFTNLEIDLEENTFISKLSILNELRRNILSELEGKLVEKYSHNLILKEENIIANNLSDSNTTNNNKNDKTTQKQSISVLLNTLNLEYNYTILNNKVDNMYIPYRLFLNKNYKQIIKNISDNFSLYIYMPHILGDRNLEKTEITLKSNIQNIINEFNIKGFVISHISQIDLLKKFNLELIGNFNLNIYNNNSIKTLENMNLKRISISPELSEEEILDVIGENNFNSELLVYGKLPLMTNHYCYLGKSNKCYPECDKKCMLNKEYYLKDRKDFSFRIVPDNTSCITTIYHNRPISFETNSFDNVNSLRFDFLDETLEEIINIIDKYKN